MASIEDIIRKVQALIARADHKNTPPPEAEACRLKAEALMFQYRVDESRLAAKAVVKAAPVWMDFPFCRVPNEFGNHYWTIMSSVVRHLDVRMSANTQRIVNEDTGESELWYVANMVGYETDLKFAMMLATECMLAFSRLLEPKVDPELTDRENAYVLRSAGMEGRRIAMALYGRDDKHLRPKVRKLFIQEATLRGEDPTALVGQGNTMKIFRRSYADGFVTTLNSRLWTMANSHDSEGALVLASRKNDVDEAFYERYPSWRPAPAKASIGDGYNDGECPRCKKAKSGLCRTHSWRKLPERKVNRTAYGRGQDAARTVNLNTRNNRLEA